MITNFLYKNMRWQFRQNTFENLVCKTTSEDQFYQQIEKIADKYFNETKHIDTLEVEFCLNKISLSRGRRTEEKVALNYFSQFWAQYVRLKNLFNKKYMTFPSNGSVTRVELIAELITKCTQFAVDDTTLERMCERTCEIVTLTEREVRYLREVVQLYKTKFYCATTLAILGKQRSAEVTFAKFLHPILLKQDFVDNEKYSQAHYYSNELASVVDCMGNSASQYNKVSTHIDVKLFVYANGRNVFDTFCKSRFGNKVAEFCSQTKTVAVKMLYYVENNTEVRKITLTNLGNCARKFSIEVPLKIANPHDAPTYLKMGNALCVSLRSQPLYCATAIVHDNTTVDCACDQALSYEVKLNKNTSFCFDIVTLYSTDTPTLANKIAELEQMGNTCCPYICDSVSSEQQSTDISLKLSPHGYVLKKPLKIMSPQLNYTYQLGSNDVATFIDNGGNSCTLLDGFAFGVGGEGVYSIANGLITKLNENDFHLDVDRLRYDKKGASCVIYHDKGKIYEITYDKPCKTLFYFPFERASKVYFASKTNTFSVDDGLRKYFVKCDNPIESYTTNALECNQEKLRYKLSGDLKTGRCLAICLANSYNVSVELTSAHETPLSTPIIRESLVSTYLNYINDKNVFRLRNNLMRDNCLTLASICYTNPQFVKNQLETIYQNAGKHTTYYYDVAGRPKEYRDKLTFPLGVVYYLNLVGELPENMIKMANGMLFNEEYTGKELCVKALALIRASHLKGFDKVRCLVEYNNLKKKINTDVKLYAYAQAIGALPLVNPSKERLKDLCNKYDIPKCWYYVSQLENLYGLNISAGRLHVCPKVTAENVLEQFALNIGGKRIDTSFAKATVQSMTLNGIQCYQPFNPQNLRNENNELVVRY